VSYIKNGELAWTKAFGVANLQTGTPVRSDMVFNHGSKWQSHDGVGPDASGRSWKGRFGRTSESLFETMADSF
jgi:hypothetical protein